MSKKTTKTRNRKLRLEKLAEEGIAFCTRHQEYLNINTIKDKRCYTGSHGRKYCKYFKIKD